jgi:hypothetical protein
MLPPINRSPNTTSRIDLGAREDHGIKDIQSENTVSLPEFPFEIPKIIYLYKNATSELTVEFIAALPPDPVLYGEILDTFWKEHIIVISYEHSTRFI